MPSCSSKAYFSFKYNKVISLPCVFKKYTLKSR